MTFRRTNVAISKTTTCYWEKICWSQRLSLRGHLPWFLPVRRRRRESGQRGEDERALGQRRAAQLVGHLSLVDQQDPVAEGGQYLVGLAARPGLVSSARAEIRPPG